MHLYQNNIRANLSDTFIRNDIFGTVAEKATEFPRLRYNKRLYASIALIYNKVHHKSQLLAVAGINHLFVLQFTQSHFSPF